MLVALVASAIVAAVGGPATARQGPPWSWPLQPRPEVVTPFEAPAGPYGPGHRGVDLAATVGQPVLAVDAGRVSFAGAVAGRGVVVVDHGLLRSTYEPVLRVVARGDRVAAGQVVGTLTLAGGHCLPTACLHLGARIGDRYVDPMDYLGGGPVRLLPRDPMSIEPSRRPTVQPRAVPAWLGTGSLGPFRPADEPTRTRPGGGRR